MNQQKSVVQHLRQGLWMALCVSFILAAAGCSAATPVAATPTAAQEAAAPTETSAVTEVVPTEAAEEPTAAVEATSAPDAPKSEIVIAGPATPSSIPLIIAAEKMGNASVQIIQNNSQANTMFLRGDLSILASGLSVGVDLYKNEAPVQILNTYVTGLSFLVTSGEAVESMADLKGKEIYLPFEGSPIEEATMYLAAQEGLVWGEDLKPVYSPFDASVALLKEGKAQAVVLPEPFVTVVESQPNLNISINYFERWNEVSGGEDGYPQVATFVTSQWAEEHPEELARFNAAMEEAILFIQENPEEAVAMVKDYFTLPEKVLTKSISRTHFSLSSGEAMQADVANYYELIGKPLDDSYAEFYYLPTE